jgi:micrococcal nuclease
MRNKFSFAFTGAAVGAIMDIDWFDSSKRSRQRGTGMARELEAAARSPWGSKRRSGSAPTFLFPRGAGRWRRSELRLLALLCAMLCVAPLSVLHNGGGPMAASDATADPPSWMRAATDPPYTEPVRTGPLVAEAGNAGHGPVRFGANAAMISARFGLCHSGDARNCVVDGDTFWSGGVKIRIADIDTPETHPPRCAAEAARGEAATVRLQALLNDGPFALEPIDRDSDRYGRKLRIVTRDGVSIGGILVNEGLARWYGGGRQPWC